MVMGFVPHKNKVHVDDRSSGRTSFRVVLGWIQTTTTADYATPTDYVAFMVAVAQLLG